MTKADKLKIMRREYGDGPGKRCGDCCNYQKGMLGSNTQICIAFGEVDYFDCSWDSMNFGCGLFNKPFLGLTPVHRPLVLVYGPKAPAADDDAFEQFELPGMTKFWQP